MNCRPLIGVVLTVVALVGCGPAASPSPSPTQADVAGSRQPSPRTLRIADRHEPVDLAQKIPPMGSSERTKRLFNAALAYVDGSGAVLPYLAESLPLVNTATWLVSQDGTMETTYRLRPNLTWHDGQPLTSSDFVFAFGVYTHRALTGIFSSVPQDKINQVIAPDARTLVIRWSVLYPDAGALVPDSVDPLPRHLLDEAFAAIDRDDSARDTFLNLPFWTAEYVGAGPYRLDRWDQGIAIEGSAFDGHALGRPKIDRIVERIISSEDTILANILAGEIDYATRTTLRFSHGITLDREWVAVGRGRTLLEETAPLAPLVQFRTEFQKSPGLLDLRVRKAIAHALDKRSILDALYDGQGHTADTLLALSEPYSSDLERAISKYAYDARQTEQFMGEAGYSKDREGFLVDGRGDRFRPEYQVFSNADSERAQLVIVDGVRKTGIDMQASVLAAALARDDQTRQTFPGLSMPGSGVGNERALLPYLTSPQIGRAANRWKGSNRGGWANPEYDRLFDSYNATLLRSERNDLAVQMMRIISDELPSYPLYYNVYVLAAVANLEGPAVGAPDTTYYWDVHLWDIK